MKEQAIELCCERWLQVPSYYCWFSIAGCKLTGSFKNHFVSFLIYIQAAERVEIVWFVFEDKPSQAGISAAVCRRFNF